MSSPNDFPSGPHTEGVVCGEGIGIGTSMRLASRGMATAEAFRRGTSTRQNALWSISAPPNTKVLTYSSTAVAVSLSVLSS